MMPKSYLKNKLQNSDDPNLPLKFAAAAVYIDESGYLYHAGIAVGSENGKSLFHYNGKFYNDPLSKFKWFIQKDFPNIPSYLADAFYVHCNELISDDAPPGYGFFYDGSFFKEGQIVMKDPNMPYRMSCVGFCLNVLKGWSTNQEDYIAYEEWNASNTLSEEKVASELAELKYLYPDLPEVTLKDGIRRIKPSEYLASAFISSSPVRKNDVEEIAIILSQIASEIRVPNAV